MPGAFENCIKLSEITLPEALTYLGNHTFTNCTSLKYIKIPFRITEIGERTFNGSGLEALELNKGLKKLVLRPLPRQN